MASTERLMNKACPLRPQRKGPNHLWFVYLNFVFPAEALIYLPYEDFGGCSKSVFFFSYHYRIDVGCACFFWGGGGIFNIVGIMLDIL